ncbi:methionine adenosyltransferase, partial [Pseudomonas protegens]|uniref:methionine adenosyltransferase domain-containing protein n=1 Tax=Pseudomonas protegens TaxID=380021 RepID=UPI0010254BE7
AKTFSFAVGDIIRDLDLRRPQFRKTAVYGHFGREDQDFAWDRTDKVQALRAAIR